MTTRGESKEKRKTRRWSALDDVMGVYIVRLGDLAKIGVSRTVGRRLRGLEHGLPAPLTLLSVLGSPYAEAIEKGLHSRFRNLRVRGEWFRFEGSLVEFASAGYGVVDPYETEAPAHRCPTCDLPAKHRDCYCYDEEDAEDAFLMAAGVFTLVPAPKH